MPSVVYTFDPPPRCYFQAPQVLTSVPKKLILFEQLGLDHVVIVRFDKVYASRPPLVFIKYFMNLNPLEIIVGEDFRFGKERKRDLKLLSQYFNVRITQPVLCTNRI